MKNENSKNVNTTKNKDKKIFENTVKKTKEINVNPKAVRGGTRL